MKTKRYLLAALFVVITFPAVAAEKPPATVSIPRLTLDMALRAAQRAIDVCRRAGVQVAVTVVDRGGHPQVVLRDVLAMDVTLPISRDKAYTAMSFNSATSDLVGRFKEVGSIAKLPGLIMTDGGIPIVAGGSILGGIGVAGSPTGKDDEKCAKAGLNAIHDDLEMSLM